MHRATSQHRSAAGATSVGTGRHQCKVIRVGMLAAFTKAAIDGFQTGGFALLACEDAVVHGL
jgi:hypothetical protein